MGRRRRPGEPRLPQCRGRRFEDVSATAGADFQKPALHRGAAFADFDNDGRIDVVVSQ